ncbi:BNR repeat-containing protein [Novosphingobium album (ex Liu et al. 2023)]|uniref:BNR repeat-containing protein n=1 Tax=Novosphingobium album (ex Liu et al. 2023) TaxID=3031130 RepID=A0ABT5WQF4_9SPHN|nr:BNR repeat-containing protein [Novosphingobium album (ex Liu et al. 2023)]MDE8652277.1 BNR repeat-containing protein [Novosphingobium album (ex Liu et al. 2023)]
MDILSGFRSKCGVVITLSAFGISATSDIASAQRVACWEPDEQSCGAPGCFDVGLAWSGQPVGFALLENGSSQIVAYYNDKRQLVVTRNDGEGFNDRTVLPTRVGWDSHNRIVMAIGPSGRLHVSGNMHSTKVNYFESDGPDMIQSLRPLAIGEGNLFASGTYPEFYKNRHGDLFYLFRTGVASDGAYNLLAYDPASRHWNSQTDGPFLDFRGAGSPYILGPYQDSNGLYHIAWTIRAKRGAENNRDIFYARSTDLARWTDSKGNPLPIPIRLDMGEKVVDSPVGSGIVNGNIRMAFDNQDRPVIVFGKYTAKDTLGIFVSRLEDGRWRTVQAKDLGVLWKISGGGSVSKELRIQATKRAADGELVARYVLRQQSYQCMISNKDLTLQDCLHNQSSLPRGLMQVSKNRAGMTVQVALASTGQSPRYLLRWETLPYNRDKPRNVAPPPSKLQLFDLKYAKICHPATSG